MNWDQVVQKVTPYIVKIETPTGTFFNVTRTKVRATTVTLNFLNVNTILYSVHQQYSFSMRGMRGKLHLKIP